MKILVTGAQGFTGRYFVPMAQNEGYEPYSLRSDLLDKSALEAEVLEVNPEFVVHLAAISNVAHNDLDSYYRVNVIGTNNLLDSLLQLKRVPKKVLLCSSANVYGNNSSFYITESEPVAPINHYSMSKVAMEFMARNYKDRLPIFFTRPFNYIGKGQSDSFLIPKLINHFSLKAKTIKLGNIDVEREFNSVSYVCNIYLKLIQKAVTGEVYNICSGKSFSLRQVIEVLSELTNHQVNLEVDSNLVRPNDIYRLCGSTEKLRNTLGDLDQANLKDILIEMLNQ